MRKASPHCGYQETELPRIVKLGHAVSTDLAACAAVSKFSLRRGDSYAVRRDENILTTPYRMATSTATGEAVRHVADIACKEICRTIPDRKFTLDSSSFILYRKDDFIGLHTDRAGCEKNALILLAGPSTYFELFPEISIHNLPRDFLNNLSKTNGIYTNHAVRLPLEQPGDCAIFPGRQIAHQRQPCSEPLLFLSLCFKEW